MPTTCSHILIWVRDLRCAVDDYRRLGFRVDYATAPDSARHAHVWFPTGPVIELLTSPSYARYLKWPIDLWAGRGAGRRMISWAARDEGYCDIAVLADDASLTDLLADLRARGAPAGRIIHWHRERPDGQTTTFRFVYPRNHRLPFIVTPYDPPQHPADSLHPNGALEIQQIRLGVRPEEHDHVRRLLGDDPRVSIEVAPDTRVLDLGIAGLSAPPDPALLHGAAIRPATPSSHATEPNCSVALVRPSI